MKKINRRTFLVRASAAVTGALASRPARVWAAEPSAELVVQNGVLVTMDERQPFAQAMAVRGGRILAVGPNEAIAAHLSRDTKVIDLAGKC
ncbi:MAG: amidohydrolase, partial [Verrucomicrobia bacterium]|nr:amidohydrolase [Verrucomicrobiota bacterium]